MSKEMLTISIEDYIVDTAEEFARAIEWRIEHDALDAVEARLNRHGWFKERTCKDVSKPGVFFECSECGAIDVTGGTGNYTLEYCPACGAKVVSGKETDVPTNAKVVE